MNLQIKNNIELLNSFLEQAKLIQSCSYMKNAKSPSTNISWTSESGLKVTSTPLPEREHIEAFLMRMRPLMEPNERLYLIKVINAVMGLTQSDKEKNYLKLFRAYVEGHQTKRLFAIKIDDKKEYGIPDFVWLYIYGKYFHIDTDKRKIINRFEQVLGSLTEISALTQVEGYAGLALILAGYIIRNKIIENAANS